MARAIWKGAISFGLVTIPVGLHSAIESRGELSFHLLHKKDSRRIDYKRFCEAEDVEVPWSEIVKGYEYTKGRYVVLTEEDFEKARVPATQTYAVRAFVPAAAIEDLYFDHPYYLAPSGNPGTKAYALLRDALRDAGKVGVGTIVLRQREHLAALEPSGRALVLTTMRFAHEIRPADSLDLPKEGAGWGKKEMQLAHQLIESLSDDWDPTEYKDTYTSVLKKVIRQKAGGKEIVIPHAEQQPAKVVDLMEALRASLAKKDLTKVPARKPAARRSRTSRMAA